VVSCDLTLLKAFSLFPRSPHATKTQKAIILFFKTGFHSVNLDDYTKPSTIITPGNLRSCAHIAPANLRILQNAVVAIIPLFRGLALST
jgi:hypothetical protein